VPHPGAGRAPDLCSGKVYYDLLDYREKNQITDARSCALNSSFPSIATACRTRRQIRRRHRRLVPGGIAEYGGVDPSRAATGNVFGARRSMPAAMPALRRRRPPRAPSVRTGRLGPRRVRGSEIILKNGAGERISPSGTCCRSPAHAHPRRQIPSLGDRSPAACSPSGM